ncbi:DJ-1/PfpI family protein [Ideonella livida]|uniref:DJ-1/PfpI family protein n=1 Tax=Ideonella livida TaxID=2707176 RepID=A0A7C9PHT7_9BURK|nr:DJ-1/PfpI family protein [Ideonella livida]NDY92375.1 DJ-1/PfpI family protein [Ideonella livida]
MSHALTLPAPVIRLVLFDEVELLDFAGPYEVFTTALRVHRRLHPGAPAPWQVRSASLHGQAVRARAGLQLQADEALIPGPAEPSALTDVTAPTALLLVPGGVVNGVLANPEMMAALRHHAEHTLAATADGLVASVCTGAFVLADLGLLHGQPCTTHWEDVADLRRRHPGLDLRPEARWVDAGRVLSSAGISAGLDMGLHLVARLHSRALALATARQMDYAWRDAEAADLPSAP